MSFSDLGVGPGDCRLVVEVGNCNNDLGWALAAIEAAAETEAVWGFKGQMYRRDTLVTRTAPTFGDDLDQPATQYELIGDSLSYDDWYTIKTVCEESGLMFFASVFDEEAVGACEQMGVKLFKTASADITNQPLLERIAGVGVPVVMSTGGATLGEISQAWQWLPNIEVLPLVCTLQYPTPISEAHLNRIVWWKENVQSEMVGYSDHTRGTLAMLTAQSLGAVMVEKHFTITPGIGGDHNFAATPTDIVDYATRLGTYFDDEGQYGTADFGPHPGEHAAILNARRSVAAAIDIPKGTVMTRDMLTCLRPGTGYPPNQIPALIGVTAQSDIPAGELVPFHRPPVTAAESAVTANLTVQ